MTLARHSAMQTRKRSAAASIFSIGVATFALLVSTAARAETAARAVASLSPAASTNASAERPASSRLEAELGDGSRSLLDWVAQTADNQGASFIIIDKQAATVHVFNGERSLLGSSPVLLGMTIGDDSVPGIGEKAIADVTEAERTTPAGRFIAERGRNAKGADVIWVDYDLALSMHRVINDVPADRRLQRLASPTPADNRISYGCVNVPIAFFESTIKPLFATYRAVVYILPEQRSVEEVFGIRTQRLAEVAQP